MEPTNSVSEVFPLLWSSDVERIVDWAVLVLGLTESWRAPDEAGVLQHAELLWPGGRVSVNVKDPQYSAMGPSGISLRIDDKEAVDAIYTRACDEGAKVTQKLADSRIAYSFTVEDPDGNHWWVNAENGFLDDLRG